MTKKSNLGGKKGKKGDNGQLTPLLLLVLLTLPFSPPSSPPPPPHSRTTATSYCNGLPTTSRWSYGPPTTPAFNTHTLPCADFSATSRIFASIAFFRTLCSCRSAWIFSTSAVTLFACIVWIVERR